MATEEVSLSEHMQVQYGVAGGRLLQPTKVPFLPVPTGAVLDGPVSWRGHGIGVAPEMQVRDNALQLHALLCWRAPAAAVS